MAMERTMMSTIATTDLMPELALRSLKADWNRERWETLPDDGNRYEVIDGVLYMSTAPSAFHQWVIHQAVRALFAQVEDTGVGVVLWAPIGLFMPGSDPVQPDILVMRTGDLGMVRDRRVYGPPALLVEVISPSNPEQDLEVKRGAYARAGVPEYWIVRPAERDVLVCSQPDAATSLYLQVRTIPPDGELVSPTLPFRAPVASFFAGAPDTTI